MSDAKVYLYILVMALVTYLIRAIPFVLFRRQIKSRFIKSLLYYLPYAVLTAMTIPDIFTATRNTLTAAIGCLAAVIFALFGKSLLTVAVAACAAAFVCDMIIKIL
ncbi:MAG: AzlD domain-containing protein [Clostridia bacterium]|nr:AzlD domain-containing protein [Clostridia bacterium]